MGCYLCAYLSPQRPKRPAPLPAGTGAAAHDDLGTCSSCAVWACSQHGTRYGKFVCAICSPAVATQQATSAGGAAPDPAARAAQVLAYHVGERARKPTSTGRRMP
jgi:hypothetical protein